MILIIGHATYNVRCINFKEHVRNNCDGVLYNVIVVLIDTVAFCVTGNVDNLCSDHPENGTMVLQPITQRLRCILSCEYAQI